MPGHRVGHDLKNEQQNSLTVWIVLDRLVKRWLSWFYPKGDQPWVFIGRTDAEAETPILWPPDAKSWLIGKDPGAGRDWRQEEKGMTEDEMAGWHRWLKGHEFEQTLGVCDGQGGLVCCTSWGCKELDTTEWLNWTEVGFAWCRQPARTDQPDNHILVEWRSVNGCL